MISAFSFNSLAAKYGQNLPGEKQQRKFLLIIKYSIFAYLFCTPSLTRSSISIGGNFTISGLAPRNYSMSIMQWESVVIYFQNIDEIDMFFDELSLDRQIFYPNYFPKISLQDECIVDHENPKQLFSFDYQQKKIQIDENDQSDIFVLLIISWFEFFNHLC